MKVIKKLLPLMFILFISCLDNQLLSQPKLEWAVTQDFKYGLNGNAKKVISADNEGRIFIAGATSDYDVITMNFNSKGELLWTATYKGPFEFLTEVAAIEADNAGNVYVAATDYENTHPYYMVILKYGIDGELIWERTYSYLEIRQVMRDMTLDKDGNIICIGEGVGPNYYYDYVTVKFDSSGNLLWGICENSPGYPNSVVTDDYGNVYVTGRQYGGNGYFDFGTIKYSPTGVRQWVALYNGTGNANDVGKSVSVDKKGNVYVIGDSYNESNIPYAVTVMYNIAGQMKWSDRQTGNSTALEVKAIDVSGTCASVFDNDSKKFSIVKYNLSGSVEWVYNDFEHYGGGSFLMEFDGVRNIYVARSLYNELTGYDVNSSKLSLSGKLHWSTTYIGPSDENVTSIALNRNGCLHICADTYRDANEFLILKYSQWTRDETVQTLSSNDVGLTNYPNPFNPSTSIAFRIQEPSRVKLEVFDALGRSIVKLLDEVVQPGEHSSVFNGEDLASGIYYYRLTVTPVSNSASSFIDTKAMLLIK